VNWASYRAWLKVGSSSTAYLNTDILLTNIGNAFANGAIAVTPFTDLQSPDSSDVQVNVYVYCDNLQVNNMTSLNFYSARKQVAAPGGAAIMSESGSVSSNTTIEVSCMDLNPSSASAQHICQEHFGEQPVSFRSLMKRYVTTRVNSFTLAAGSLGVGYFTFRSFPVSAVPYGTTNNKVSELFTYLRYAYLGYKGGIRSIFGVSSTTSAQLIPFVTARVSLLQPSTSFSDSYVFNAGDMLTSALEGTVINNMNFGSTLHVETPFYSNNLFVYPISETLDDGLASLDMMEATWCRGFKVAIFLNSSPTTVKAELTQAAGEDFSFLRFLGAPYYTIAP